MPHGSRTKSRRGAPGSFAWWQRRETVLGAGLLLALLLAGGREMVEAIALGAASSPSSLPARWAWLLPLAWLLAVALGALAVLRAGEIDFSAGAVMLLAAAGAGWVHDGMAPQVSALTAVGLAGGAALAIGLACGGLNGILVAGAGLRSPLLTFATAWGFLVVGGRFEAEAAGGAAPWPGFDPAAAPWGAGGILLATLAAGAFLLDRVGLGRRIEAVGSDAGAARLAGLPVGRTRLEAYLVAGAAAGVAGLVWAAAWDGATGETGPFAAMGLTMMGIGVAILGGASPAGGRAGGRGTVAGLALAALLAVSCLAGLVPRGTGGLVFGGPGEAPRFWSVMAAGLLGVALILDRLGQVLRERQWVRARWRAARRQGP